MGTLMGAVTRSAGRTQSAVSALTGRNSTPNTTGDSSNSSQSRHPIRNIAAAAKSPAPIPVSRGLGSLRRTPTAGGTGRPAGALITR